MMAWQENKCGTQGWIECEHIHVSGLGREAGKSKVRGPAGPSLTVLRDMGPSHTLGDGLSQDFFR